MINKKFMILAIFLVSLLAVSAVSAADNATGDIVNVEETDEVVSVENNDVGTFNELSDLIKNTSKGGILELDKDYQYINDSSNEGIQINKSITIDGKGHSLDGNRLSRIFYVSAEKVTLKDITFINGYGEDKAGGAVYWSGGNGALSNCTFENCYVLSSNGGYGGAVFWNGADGTLFNCSFINCYVISEETKNVYGGAVFWKGAEGTLFNCSFVNCHADVSCFPMAYGGAVFWNGTKGNLFDCSFVNCHSQLTGGAVDWKGADGALYDCSFVNCSTKFYGGAVYCKGSNCVLYGSNFMNCYADESGGAIYFIYENGRLYNCSFVNCSVDYGNGGAVDWNGDDGALYDCSFVNCSTKSDGGAVCRFGFNGTLYDCSFANCSADSGGAVCLFSLRGAYGHNVYNCTFMNCYADESGGAVAFYSSNSSLSNCNFYNNLASTGNAVYWMGENGLINKSYFSPNFNSIYSLNSDLNIIKKYLSSLICENISFNYGDNVNLSAYLNTYGKVIFNISNEYNTKSFIVNTTNDGIASLSDELNELTVGLWNVTVIFEGDDNYNSSSTTAKVTVNKLDTILTAEYDANSKNIVAVVKDANGNPIKGLKVGFALNGVKYVDTDANGQAKYSTAGLADGIYKVTVRAYGNEIYKNSSKETVTFTIGNKEKSKIFLRNALFFVTQTKLVQVTLWDGNNQPLANKTVSIRAYDSVWRGVTDENGDAFVRVGIGFGVHDATVSFDGDDQYNSSTRAGYIRVIKQTPSVMVRGADTMFKANDDNKIVKVHLRDRYDKALPEGSKIVIKLNGKTYVGTTDINGVAHIKISINTVGTFTAQAMYGGNTAYNPVTRDVKIRIV